MKRKIMLLLSILLTLGVALSHASDKSESKKTDQKQESQDHGTFSETEKEIVIKALQGKATKGEKKQAQDVCKKKCKVCYDGVTCDLECARKSCL